MIPSSITFSSLSIIIASNAFHSSPIHGTCADFGRAATNVALDGGGLEDGVLLVKGGRRGLVKQGGGRIDKLQPKRCGPRTKRVRPR